MNNCRNTWFNIIQFIHIILTKSELIDCSITVGFTWDLRDIRRLLYGTMLGDTDYRKRLVSFASSSLKMVKVSSNDCIDSKVVSWIRFEMFYKILFADSDSLWVVKRISFVFICHSYPLLPWLKTYIEKLSTKEILFLPIKWALKTSHVITPPYFNIRGTYFEVLLHCLTQFYYSTTNCFSTC